MSAQAHVLLVDDSPLVVHAVSKRLRELAISAVVYDSVASSVGATLADVACALLDLELADGDGVAIANHLRATAPNVAIAFFSGGAPDDLRARASALGRVFTKPDDLEEAIAWIVASLAASLEG